MSNKLDEATRAYNAARARLEKLAEPVKGWRAELTTLEGEIPALKSERIAALSDGQGEAAEELDEVIGAKTKRLEDLQAMIERRRTDICAAIDHLAANESHALMLAKIESAAIARLQAAEDFGKLAPAYNAASARLQAAQASEMATAYYAVEFSDQRNRAAWRASTLFELLGDGEKSDYSPTWLMN